MERRRARSAPVYVQTPHGTISLVFEATVRGSGTEGGQEAPQFVGKPDVYVINDDGVRLVRHRNKLARSLLAGVAICLLLWAVFRLVRARITITS